MHIMSIRDSYLDRFFAELKAMRLLHIQSKPEERPTMSPAEYIMTHVRTQLLGGSGDKPNATRSPYAPLAVLDVRLALDLDPHTDIALKVSQRMVTENMRVVFHDPKRPHAWSSSYPSEPVLAEAAAQQMWHWRPGGPEYMSLLDVLVAECKSGLISLDDDDASLVGRFMLLNAHDHAIGTLPPKPDAPIPNQPWFSEELPLPRFIASIFTKEKAARVLGCLPDNDLHGQCLEAELKDAFVHFTHFVKVKSTAITIESLRGAYIRGAAFRIVGRVQPVHCVIPVRIKKGPGLQSVFSFIAFVFNNGNEPTSPLQMRLDPKALVYFPEHDQYTRPFIVLAMDFDIPSNKCGEEDDSAQDTMMVDDEDSVAEPGALRSRNESGHVHPRYTIQTFGMSPDTYQVSDRDQKKYHYLLTSQRGTSSTEGDIFTNPIYGADGGAHLDPARGRRVGMGWKQQRSLVLDYHWKTSMTI